MLAQYRREGSRSRSRRWLVCLAARHRRVRRSVPPARSNYRRANNITLSLLVLVVASRTRARAAFVPRVGSARRSLARSLARSHVDEKAEMPRFKKRGWCTFERAVAELLTPANAMVDMSCFSGDITHYHPKYWCVSCSFFLSFPTGADANKQNKTKTRRRKKKKEKKNEEKKENKEEEEKK